MKQQHSITDYYHFNMKITPKENIFNEIIKIATIIWMQYDNQYGYVTEKLDIINNIMNYQDNVMIAYRMFDHFNQSTFRKLATEETLEYIKDNN